MADGYSADAGDYGMPDQSNGDDWFEQNAPPPPPQNPGPQGVGDPGNDANQIQGWASQFLGHPFDQDTLDGLKGQPLDLVMHNIANSAEARAYAARGTGGQQGGGNSTLSGILAPFTGSWNYQMAPQYEKPPAFAYDKPMPTFTAFEAPTLDEAKKEPGFEFGRAIGQQGIENSAAGRGLLRTGGTLKDILAYNQNFANQNYQNVYSRDYNTWQGNQSGAWNSWMNGLNSQAQIYNTNYKSQYTDPFDFAMRSTGANNDNSWKKFLQDYDIFRNNQKDPFDKLIEARKSGQPSE